MIESYFKPYTLAVQILSPVHIGSGVKLGKNDYFRQDGLFHVIDENKLLSWIIDQPNPEKLALALADDLRRLDSGIEKFLHESFSGDVAEITAYSLPGQGSPKDVSAFIKQVDNQPYLPGSSIKGVLRSALLRGKMLGNEGLRQKAVKAIDRGADTSGRPKTNSDQIQANVFVDADVRQSQWSNYDINRLLLVRDSETISADQLEISAVKTYSLQYDKSLKPKAYDIFVETLRARSLTQHSISWQTNLLQQSAGLLGFHDLADLMIFLPDYCRRVSQNLLSQEIKFYERHARHDLAEWFQKYLDLLSKIDQDVFILPMGWGSGYDAKTITDLLGSVTFEKVVNTYKNTWGLGKPGRRKDSEWMGANDSPKSRKIIERQGKAEPMGWVACRFVASDQEDWLSKQREVRKEHKPVVLSDPFQQALSTPPAAEAPTTGAESKTIEPTPRAMPKLIAHFNATPQRGDCFEGDVFDQSSGEILLLIPGIEDVDAYAVLRPGNYPQMMKSFKVIKCVVIGLEPDKAQKNCVRVLCKAL